MYNHRPMTAPSRLNLHAYAGLALFAATISALLSATQRIGAEYGLETRQIGFLLGAYFLSFFASSVIGGLISGKTGMKPVLLAGYGLTALGLSVFVGSTGATHLAMAVVAIGLGGGILEGMTTSLLLAENPARTRQVVAMSQLFYCIGALGGTALVGVLFASQIPWRMAFAGLLLPALVLGAVLFALPVRSPGAEGPSAVRRSSPGWILLFSALLFLFVYVETGLTSWIPFLLGTSFELPEPQPQWIFAAFWAAFLLARLFISFGRHAIAAPKFTLAAFSLLMLPLLALCLPVPFPATVAAIVLCGLFASPLWILIVTWANEHVAPAQASLVVGAGGLAAGSSPFISAPVIEWGGARGHFGVLLGVTAAAIACTLVLRGIGRNSKDRPLPR